MALLGSAVLTHRHRRRAGGHRSPSGQRLQCRGRHVLELGRDRRAALGELAEAVLVEVGGLDVMVRHQARGAGWIAVEHRGEVTHLLRRVHEHAAELPTAHDAQGGAGRDETGHVSCEVIARAASVCRAR